MSAESAQPWRLPIWQRPIHYDLLVLPDIRPDGPFTFEAHVYVDLLLSQASDTIVLNALDLKFPEATTGGVLVTKREEKDAVPVSPKEVTLNAEQQRVSFVFASPLTAGSYRLSIRYSGSINDQLCGFYRSSYTRPDGTKTWLACTQFEATDARRALPCVDEPAAKATFTVTLVVPDGLTSVSNMPATERIQLPASFASVNAAPGSALHSLLAEAKLRRIELPPHHTVYRYAPSPVMSTYLLAYCIGEFDYVSGYTKDNVEVRIYTPLGKSHLAAFSLDVAIRCLQYYNAYFEIAYPLPKCDLMAIPDFAAGAMENWGAVFYRETALLIDPLNSSAAIKQRCARTVAHELAHMWFGNLVTMEWWTYLWLNEGFARFTEHQAVHHIFPEWDIWTQFVSDVFASAQGLDSLETSHPIEVPVKYSEEVSEIFDTISYAKGASVIRMLHATIGDAAWRKGLHAYMTRHQYANAVTEDLWKALSDAAGIDIAKLMDVWIKKTGYPMLTVIETAGGTGDNRTFTISQTRFFANMVNRKSDPSELWSVPIIVRTVSSSGHSSEYKLLLDKPSADFTIPCGSAAVTFNAGQLGFYRTHLAGPLFDKLSASVPHMLPVDRLGIQRDSFALAMAGVVPAGAALELLLQYREERNFSVASAFSGNLSGLASMHGDQPHFEHLQKFLRHLYQPQLARLGWDRQSSEDHQTAMFRSTVISLLGTAADPQVSLEASRRFAAFVADPATPLLPGDLRGAVYHIVMKASRAPGEGLSARDSLLAIYRRTELAEERVRVLGAIGAVSGKGADDQKVIEANLQWAFGDSDPSGASLRSADLPYILSSTASSRLGRELSWAHLQRNWDSVMAKLSQGQSFLLSGVLGAVLSGNTEAAAADQIEQWFVEHPTPSAARTVKQVCEAIRTKAARLERERAQVKEWLAAHIEKHTF